MTQAIEVTFNPTADDYTIAQRWIGRKALGGWYKLYISGLMVCAVGLVFGFILLLDGAYAYGNGPLHQQAMLGSAVFLISVFAFGLLLSYTRRKLGKLIMRPDGYFLAQRTMSFSETGIHNHGGIVEMQVPWAQVLGVFEDKSHIYVQLEPAFTLFIPKRVIANPDDQTQLKNFILEKLAKSAANI